MLGAAFYVLATGDPSITIGASLRVPVVAGLLIGFGTRLGSGCTSGHGLCGIARLSKRSVAATAVFFGLEIANVYLVRHAL